MLKDSKFLQQVVVSLAAVMVTALFFVGSYKYEESFLTSSGVSAGVAREVAEVDMRTYQGWLESSIFVGVAVVIIVGLIFRTPLRNFFRSGLKSLFFISFVAFALLAIRIWLYPMLGVSKDHSLFVLTELAGSIASIILVALTVVLNADFKTIKGISFKNPSQRNASIILLAVALYWTSYGFTHMIASLASAKVSFERPQENIVISEKEYTVVRTYVNKTLLFETGEKKSENLIVWYRDSDHMVGYRNK